MFSPAMMPLAMAQMGRFGASPSGGLNYKPGISPDAVPPRLNGGPSMDDPGVAQMPPSYGQFNDLHQPMRMPPLDVPNVTMPQPKPKGGMFGSGKGGKIAQVIAAGLYGYLAARGNPAGMAGLQHLHRMREAQAENEQRLRELQAKRFEPMSVGGSLIQLGEDGQYRTLYDAPQAFEKYAQALGYQPGTPEYQGAVQDYRLGSWSDPAMEARQTLEGVRYGYRDDLQDQRLDVTRRGQDMRDATARRGQDITQGNNIRTTGVSSANARLRAQTQRGAYSYSNGGKGGGKGEAIPDGTVIRNPSTGQRMKRKGGQWVPIS